MTPISKQLSKKEVINNNQIKEIKEAINIQYQSATSKEKATLFAKSIYDIIDNSLPNFSTQSKRNVRMALINRKLSTNSLSINANDIVEYSIEFVPLEELNKELLIWVKNEVEVDPDLVEKYLDNLLNSYKKIESEIAASNYPNLNEMVEIANIQVDEAISPLKEIFFSEQKKWRAVFLGATLIFFVILPIILIFDNSTEKTIDTPINETVKAVEKEIKVGIPNELPSHLQYKSINDVKLRAWLEERDSLLADERYFFTILEVAAEFNIHPLLLFAITGQEQGFVPRNHKNATKIANNPFNVFHSWKDFNTNISESSQIAARTIVNVSKDRPKDVDPIQWINRKYAEDKNWWLGVSTIFNQLVEAVQ